MGMAKRTPCLTICVLCRRNGLTTREHVIPSCMYDKGQDKEVFVRLCSECNNVKSRYDGILRTVFAVSPASKAPVSVVDKAKRSIQRGDLTKDLLHQVPLPVPYFDQSGHFIGNHIALGMTTDMQDAVFFLVLELYSYFFPGNYLSKENLRYADTGTVFSTCCRFYSNSSNQHLANPKSHSDSVLNVKYDYLQDDYETGVWSLKFYDDRRIFVLSTSDIEDNRSDNYSSWCS